MDSDKIEWLANEIFVAFPKEVTGLKFYMLDCGCIYYHRVFGNAKFDLQVGIYRDGDDGPCEICMHLEKDWEDRVNSEVVVYKANLQAEPET